MQRVRAAQISAGCLLLVALLAPVSLLAGATRRIDPPDRQAATQQAAPSPATPTHMASPAKPIARIGGTIVAGDTGGPLRQATVQLVREGGGARVATSDDDGRYDFADLPAGRYTVVVNKPGYLAREYAQAVDQIPGRPIELGHGERVRGISITLPRNSAIVGRLADRHGDPVVDARVRALRYQVVRGRRRLVASSRVATSDDLGNFRLFGLTPGEYYVSAVPGEFDDSAGVSAATDGHASTYYPGTTDVADAQRITVVLGQDAAAEFLLSSARLVSVSGSVVTSSGPAESGRVELHHRTHLAAGTLPANLTAPIATDGTFTIARVAPGTYTLVAEAESPIRGAPVLFTRRERETGAAWLTVGTEDLTGATVTTSPGTTLAGKIVIEGGERLPMDRVRVRAHPTDPGDPEADINRADPAVPRGDGSFELHGLRGQLLFSVEGLPSRFFVERVTISGRDVTDSGVKTGATPFTQRGLQIVVSSRLTELAGSVHEGSTQRRDYVTVCFSTDSTKWTHPLGRYSRVARPDQHGRFRVAGLPPGEYFVVALDHLRGADEYDVDVLQTLRDQGTRVRLGAGDARVLDLELAR